MNYVIHPSTDLDPQIRTCILADPECQIEAHLADLNNAGRAFKAAWDERGYRVEYERLTAEKELTRASAEAEVETLRELLANSLAELERIVPMIDAAYALEKEADYLHPFSLDVSNVLSGFRAAVLRYKKVDRVPAKS